MSPRKRRIPVSFEDLCRHPNGPPVRLADLADITGWSEDTILGDLDRGDLEGQKRTAARNAPWEFQRVDVLDYLARHNRKISA